MRVLLLAAVLVSPGLGLQILVVHRIRRYHSTKCSLLDQSFDPKQRLQLKQARKRTELAVCKDTRTNLKTSALATRPPVRCPGAPLLLPGPRR